MTMSTIERPLRRRFAVYPSHGVDKVIGDEVRRQGYCDLSQREIARRADRNMRTVGRRLTQLAEAGMISICQRAGTREHSITNLVRITSPTWRTVLGLS